MMRSLTLATDSIPSRPATRVPWGGSVEVRSMVMTSRTSLTTRPTLVVSSSVMTTFAPSGTAPSRPRRARRLTTGMSRPRRLITPSTSGALPGMGAAARSG